MSLADHKNTIRERHRLYIYIARPCQESTNSDICILHYKIICKFSAVREQGPTCRANIRYCVMLTHFRENDLRLHLMRSKCKKISGGACPRVPHLKIEHAAPPPPHLAVSSF